MKILIVYDLAQQSTRDVADGLVAGIRSLGHDVFFSPVHQYTQHMLKGYEKHDDIPPEIWTVLHATVNKIIMGDAALFAPDVMLVISGWAVASQAVAAVRRIGVRTVLYLTESPYVDEQQLGLVGGYDTVVCNELSSMPVMRAHHHDVLYLPHSFNPEVHRPTPGPAPECDAYFCGTGFSERLKVFGGVNWDGIRLKLQGFFPRADRYGLTPYVTDQVVQNKTLPAIYSNVPINLNVHRTTKSWDQNADTEEHITWAESIGPRVFEVLACGGFLLTDHREEMRGFLEDGEHLATFSGPVELEEKVRYYLAHPDERAKIAAAGRRAVAGCTFSSRAQQILLPQLTDASKGVK